MQGTVYRFDPQTRCGSVLLDDGREVAFGADEFDRSGLRHVRPGQRLTLDVGDGRAVRLGIVGIGPADQM